MARLLVVSDSFGNISKLDDVLRKYKGDFDLFYHLGNRSYDTMSLQESIPNAILIRGNMELDHPRLAGIGTFEDIRMVEGINVFATHGHRYSVKSTLIFIKKHAVKIGAKLVLFGNTQEKFLEFEDDILYFNPGALMNNDYGIIELNNGEITVIEHGYLSEKW